MSNEHNDALEDIEIGASLPAKGVYQAVREQGLEELARPTVSLWWSGVAAGIAISASLWTSGILHHHLPDEQWRTLISGLGYSVGFIIVILGRMQLFTENTITPVLPLLADYSHALLRRMLVLWGIVLCANLLGGFLVAAFAHLLSITEATYIDAYLAVAGHFVNHGPPLHMLARAIPAGFYIAALVWMLPNSRGFELWVIILMSYLIVLGENLHVIVGSVETFVVLIAGQITVWEAFFEVLLPVLIGNIIGGSLLFSVLAYAQVKEELRH